MENGQARARHLASNIVVIQSEYSSEFTIMGPHQGNQIIFCGDNPKECISSYIKTVKSLRDEALDQCDLLDRHFTSEGATILSNLEY